MRRESIRWGNVSDLHIELLRRIILRLEHHAGVSRDDQELRELRELLVAIELIRRVQEQSARERDWTKLLPLALLLAVLIAAIIAAFLGVDVRSMGL